MKTGPQRPIAILGGGLTGLAAARTLATRGRAVRLFEAAPRTGGVIQSEITPDGWLVEAGPNTLQLADASVRTLVTQLGLDRALQPARPEARHRYVRRDGRSWPLPLSPTALLATGLFSWRLKLRLLRELWRRPRIRNTDISLALLVEAHFGRELVDYVLQPFVGGVYAGDAARLSARHAFPGLWAAEQRFGSLLRGQLRTARERRDRGELKPEIVSFARGLQQLPDALAAALPPGVVECSARVETLLPDPEGWKLVWTRGSETFAEPFRTVLLALPAPALARVTVGPLAERPLAGLDAMDLPALSSVFLGYRRDQVGHPLDGFGLLVPAVEKRQVLGALFPSSLFPGRAPAGHVALNAFIGGALNPDHRHLEPGAAAAIAERDLASLLNIQGPPVFVRHHAWPRAIPQYNLGHERFLDTIARAEQAHPGLLVGGTARDGISLPACLAAGQRLAERGMNLDPA